jgi:hypothetical protein
MIFLRAVGRPFEHGEGSVDAVVFLAERVVEAWGTQVFNMIDVLLPASAMWRRGCFVWRTVDIPFRRRARRTRLWCNIQHDHHATMLQAGASCDKRYCFGGPSAAGRCCGCRRSAFSLANIYIDKAT